MNLSEVFPPPSEGESPLCRVFGVRHLSPAAAFHLRAVLDELKPTAVLVEGPADATEHIKHFLHKETRPPLAVLAYTQTRPVRSILYPLASYSPEWVALTWGLRNKAETRFIDLPAAVFLELHHAAPPMEQVPSPETAEEGDGQEDAAAPTPSVAPTPSSTPAAPRQASEHTLAYLDDPWTAIAELSGDPDHETWWERHFEHTTDPTSYVRQIYEFGRGLRGLRHLGDKDENLIRESYMRRCIREVLDKGHKPDRVLVVCGAFHGSALCAERPAMTDKEFKALPQTKCNLTLMPYSYFRLSSQSGYGAGNHAPAYYQRLYDERCAGHTDRLGPHFLTELCHGLRKGGQIRSAAEVIEAVRLAHSLASLADSPAPCLRDFRDAATCCLGRGEFEVIRPVLTELEVGHEVGKLPKGVSRTAIQDDFYLQIEQLHLEKYLKDQAQELELDLRENRTVKTVEAAFRQRNASIFLHRLQVLGIQFGRKSSRFNYGTWKEIWAVRWQPESEIQLAESSLLADTVEMATAIRLSQRLAECHRVDEAAEVVNDAVLCELADAMEDACRRLQAMAVEATGFVQLANAVEKLTEVVSYGSVRKFDPQPLKPLLAQLFLRATLAVRDSCVCDAETAREQIRPAIAKLQAVAVENPQLVDAVRWNRELDDIASSDNLNAYLSGFVLGLILSRVLEDTLDREVSRRLSAGVPPDIGAAWFEGLASRGNRQALFLRLALWRQLDAYLQSLDEDGFRLAVVPLRRAFAEFQVSEVRRVVSNLVEISQEGAEELKQSVDVKMSDEEAAKLNELLGDLGDLGI